METCEDSVKTDADQQRSKTVAVSARRASCGDVSRA
jgi:hypothetical protein